MTFMFFEQLSRNKVSGQLNRTSHRERNQIKPQTANIRKKCSLSVCLWLYVYMYIFSQVPFRFSQVPFKFSQVPFKFFIGSLQVSPRFPQFFIGSFSFFLGSLLFFLGSLQVVLGSLLVVPRFPLGFAQVPFSVPQVSLSSSSTVRALSHACSLSI